MARVLNKIREELFKISDIVFYDEKENGIRSAMEEFIDNITYLRTAPEDEIINHFRNILYFDKEESLKFLFFIRDIKNGLGERKIFRVILKYLGTEYPELIENNLRLIPKYGRWDDLYYLFYTPLEEKVICLYKSQIQKDLSSERPSTLAKWLKSENTSSKETRTLGNRTRLLLDFTPKEYRKLLSRLRKKINLVEINLSSKKYCNIKYERLSTLSLNKYKKTFLKNDYKRYEEYLNNKKISNNIYPDNVIESILNKYDDLEVFNKEAENLISNIIKKSKFQEDTIIVNGLEESENNKILSIFIFTILLYKKINSNAFKNYYMSFKKNPKFNKLTELNFAKNVNLIYSNYKNFNIDLKSSLDLLLFTLLKKNVNIELIPKSILYVYNTTEKIDLKISEDFEEKWLKAGFDFPKIKLWNLKDLTEKFSIKYEDDVVRITGYNNNMWAYLLESREITNSQIILESYNNIKYNDLIT
jgi:hypothetical protein